MNNVYTIFYGFLLGGILCAQGVYAQERMTNEAGAYSYEVPPGFAELQEASGSAVTLKQQNVLSASVPTITMSVLSTDDALQRYEDLDARLKRARYSRQSSVRLLKRKSLKTTREIPGWELTWLEPNASGSLVYSIFTLLDRDNEHMLLISGNTLLENRPEFALLYDALVNSVEYGP